MYRLNCYRLIGITICGNDVVEDVVMYLCMSGYAYLMRHDMTGDTALNSESYSKR